MVGPILLKNENNTVEEKRNFKTETISTTDDSVIDFDTERPIISTANAKDIKTEDITTTINSSTGINQLHSLSEHFSCDLFFIEGK